MQIDKDFDQWNKVKKGIYGSEVAHDFFFREREVWWCALGVNIGVEADGKHDSFERPVLVIRKFNKEMFWGAPFTSHRHSSMHYTKITHERGVSWATLSQLRTWSSRRLLRKIGKISESDFDDILAKITVLIKNETSP